MRYNVMQITGGFEVHYGEERAEIIRNGTIISYHPVGLAAVVVGLNCQRLAYLEVSEDTKKVDLLNALENEVLEA